MTDTTLAHVQIETPSNDSSHKAAALREVLRSQVIESAEDYELVALFLRDAKAQRRAIDDERRKIKRPIDAAAAAVQAFFARPLAWLDEAESIAKSKLIAYDREQERIRVERQREIDEQVQREREEAESYGDEHAGAIVAPIIETDVPKVAGLSMREIWRHRVVDPALVPREYLCVDDKKIAAVVRAMKGDTRIAGIEVYPDTIAASRS